MQRSTNPPKKHVHAFKTTILSLKQSNFFAILRTFRIYMNRTNIQITKDMNERIIAIQADITTLDVDAS